MVVKDHSGPCIDLALLLAACCELHRRLPGHLPPERTRLPRFLAIGRAPPAVHQDDRRLRRRPATEEPTKTTVAGGQRATWWSRDPAYVEIMRRVRMGNLVPLESVWLTEHSGFEEAVDGGRDDLKKMSHFHSMLDIVEPVSPTSRRCQSEMGNDHTPAPDAHDLLQITWMRPSGRPI